MCVTYGSVAATAAHLLADLQKKFGRPLTANEIEWQLRRAHHLEKVKGTPLEVLYSHSGWDYCADGVARSALASRSWSYTWETFRYKVTKPHPYSDFGSMVVPVGPGAEVGGDPGHTERYLLTPYAVGDCAPQHGEEPGWYEAERPVFHFDNGGTGPQTEAYRNPKKIG